MKVVITGLAQDDIREITLYIENELHNTLAVNKFLEKLLRRLQLLSQFPEIGPMVKINDTMTRSRYLVIDNYLLLYMVTGSCLYVTRIVYGQSNYLQYLGDN